MNELHILNKDEARAEKVATLNDQLRSRIGQGLPVGNNEFVITQGIWDCFNNDEMTTLFHNIKTFDDFSEDNDPHKERDFGSLTAKGRKIFWKIDYYDNDLQYHSPDNTDPTQTRRVMTVMLSDEY